MMDLAHITGGCHYTLGCNNFKFGCIDCPALSYKNKKLAFDQQLAKSINISKFKGEILAFSDKDLLSAKDSSIPFYKYWRLDIPFNKPIKFNKSSNSFNILPSAYSFYNTRKGIDNFKQVLYIIENKLSIEESINIFNTNYPDEFKNEFKKIKFINFEFCNDSSKLNNLYFDTSLLVFTSYADSAPQMVVESIISNTKVFAYEVGNLSELINNENGLLIPDYDPHKMADAIIQFYRKWNSNSTDLKISSSVKKYYDDENFKIHFTKIING
jgi:glycosyltransferase involved in cell wall biosynthesis